MDRSAAGVDQAMHMVTEPPNSAHLRGQEYRHTGLAMIRTQSGRADEALEPTHQMLCTVQGM